MFDLIIKQAQIVDGTGQPSWTGDVAVKDGMIMDAAPKIEAQSENTVDAQGLVLCPGFIDPHSHWDAIHLNGGQAEIKLRQGVCTDLVGNCGESIAPCESSALEDIKRLFPESARHIKPCTIAQYADDVDAARPGLRVMTHVGHGSLRISAMGQKAGPPTPDQMKHMERALRQAFEQGAAGISTGLYYTPSGYADEEELKALMRLVAEYDRFHASHIRNEAEYMGDALEEVIGAGLATGATTHISHLKLAGRGNWGNQEQVFKIFEDARTRGLDLTCDVYPYHHSCTTILSLIPPWAREGGVPGLMNRLKSRQDQKRITHEITHGFGAWESSSKNAGFDGIVISDIHTGQRPDLIGKTLAQAATEAGLEPIPFILELIGEICGAANIICASMNEENTAAFMKLPFAMIGSDGVVNGGKPHPRAYGSFPKVIRRFVRELKILSLEEAIHKMSGKTADRLGIGDAGVIAKGKRADMVLFDYDTFGDTATFENPRSFATGLHAVFFNGKQVVDETGQCRPGAGGFLSAGKII